MPGGGRARRDGIEWDGNRWKQSGMELESSAELPTAPARARLPPPPSPQPPFPSSGRLPGTLRHLRAPGTARPPQPGRERPRPAGGAPAPSPQRLPAMAELLVLPFTASPHRLPPRVRSCHLPSPPPAPAELAFPPCPRRFPPGRVFIP